MFILKLLTSLSLLLPLSLCASSRLDISASKNPEIVQLDTTNYGLAVSSAEVWVIEFFSPRCSTCEQFDKIWKQIANQLGEVQIGSVNIDTDEGLELARQLGVLDEGVPNVRALVTQGDRNGETVFNGFEVPSQMDLLKMVRKVIEPNMLGMKSMKLAPQQ
eukprot:TRINITY_DN1398_c0_g1_i1.p2 TRINITY_DN1398_c0_g1~~TRINITY_DN1398_c0_g1_i1.p2  ORF type:complete len:161 (+),score=18.69 TRINITY_DN1398_c0_g1_i1:16-498(+)